MLFDAKCGLLVHIKLMLLLPSSMAGSTLMAGTLKQYRLNELKSSNWHDRNDPSEYPKQHQFEKNL